MTNVTGDSLGAGIVYHYSKNELPPVHGDSYEYPEGNPDKRDNVPNGTEGNITAV